MNASGTIFKAALWMHRLGGLLSAVVGVIIVGDVLGRLLFNRPFEGTVELVAILLVVLTFLQVPYVILERKLLRVTFLLDAVPPAVRRWLNVLAYLVGALFFAAICAVSLEPTLQAIREGEYFGTDAVRIPGWPLRIGTLLLWGFAAVVCLHLAWQALRGRMSAKEEQLPD